MRIKERLESSLKQIVNSYVERVIQEALDDARNELIDTSMARDITLDDRRKLYDLKEDMLVYIGNALNELENRIKVQIDLYRKRTQNKFQTMNNIRHIFRVYRSRIQTILFTELHRIYIHTKYYMFLNNNIQYIEVGPGSTEIDRKLRGIYPIEKTPLPPFHPNCTVDIHPVTGDIAAKIYHGDEITVERLRDILQDKISQETISQLARQLGINRKTLYKILHQLKIM